MTNIAYLILAYDNPMHLKRLVSSLDTSQSSFFIHIDLKTNINDFMSIGKENVYFSDKRIKCYWGDYSCVKATLILIELALNQMVDYNYLVLLSGACYPLQKTKYIEVFFESSKNKEFINIIKIPSVEAGKPIERLTRYKLYSGDPRIKQVIIGKMQRVNLCRMRKNIKRYLGNLIPYGGSNWWALTRTTCAMFLEFVRTNPKFVNFFQNTIIPEESFFQTIIGNLVTHEKIAGNLTYTDWSKGGPSPAEISEEHLELFHKPQVFFEDAYGLREVLFARKFSDKNPMITNMLDNIIHNKSLKE